MKTLFIASLLLLTSPLQAEEGLINRLHTLSGDMEGANVPVETVREVPESPSHYRAELSENLAALSGCGERRKSLKKVRATVAFTVLPSGHAVNIETKTVSATQEAELGECLKSRLARMELEETPKNAENVVFTLAFGGPTKVLFNN